MVNMLFIVAFILIYANGEAVDQCCRKHQVPDICVKTLCNPSNPPGDFDVYDIFERRNNCSKHLKTIAQCLADGRNHSHCCETEAKDREENACFGLCQGEGLEDASWTGYQTCIAINLPSMFTCFQKGYDNIPSAPQRLIPTITPSKPIQLSWEAPLINSDLAHYYQVVCVENDSTVTTNAKIVKETRAMHVTLDDLQPGTKYYCYAIAVARDGKRRSLASEKIHFQTAGSAPRMFAYRDTVSSPKNAPTAILACRFQISGAPSKLRLEWHRRQGKSFKQLEGSRYNLTHYVSSYGKPREYVTTLEIRNVNQDDYATYRCHVSYEFGTAHADVQLIPAETSRPDSRPPDTPFACCKYHGVEGRCMNMCGLENEVRRSPNIPQNCSTEIGKVLSCAMPAVDDSACCLRARVPRACMYLCDSFLPPSSEMPAVCKNHLDDVVECRYNGALKRPSAPKDVKVSSSSDSQVLLNWKDAERAEVYHVYWRKHHSTWDKKSVTATSKTISGADEVVVVAANSYGLSQPVKLSQINNKWHRG
uniref:Ig-like and fibronectin type-III domain-containing protein C25G4.10 n=1 Tax=Panagrolaimus sp. ES5 TaxID=591445 RepID=A0AC34FUC4_9BILA